MNRHVGSGFTQKIIVLVGLLAIVLGMTGGQWDSWHHVKHDHVVFALPHLIIIGGLGLFTLSGILAVFILARGRLVLSAGEKKGLWFVVSGGLTLPMALVLDELSHALWGLDQTAWSAPHALMFLSVASVLFGLAVFTLHKSRLGRSVGFLRGVLPVLYFATMLLLGLFSLGDFDQPHMKFVADIRPGFAYVITATGIAVFTLVLMAAMVGRVGAVTAAALLAWGFHAGVGYIVGEIGGFFHTLPPYPLIVPAAALDAYLLVASGLSKQPKFNLTPQMLIAASLIATGVCYWTIIGWASIYTRSKLPQQISGGPLDWTVWFIVFVSIFPILSALITKHLSSWALKGARSL